MSDTRTIVVNALTVAALLFSLAAAAAGWGNLHDPSACWSSC